MKKYDLWAEYGPTANDIIEYSVQAATQTHAKKLFIEYLEKHCKSLYRTKIGPQNIYIRK